MMFKRFTPSAERIAAQRSREAPIDRATIEAAAAARAAMLTALAKEDEPKDEPRKP